MLYNVLRQLFQVITFNTSNSVQYNKTKCNNSPKLTDTIHFILKTELVKLITDGRLMSLSLHCIMVLFYFMVNTVSYFFTKEEDVFPRIYL